MQGARTLAAFRGRDYAVPDDVVEIALPALRHRVILTAEAEVEGQNVDDLLQRTDSLGGGAPAVNPLGAAGALPSSCCWRLAYALARLSAIGALVVVVAVARGACRWRCSSDAVVAGRGWSAIDALLLVVAAADLLTLPRRKWFACRTRDRPHRLAAASRTACS